MSSSMQNKCCHGSYWMHGFLHEASNCFRWKEDFFALLWILDLFQPLFTQKGCFSFSTDAHAIRMCSMIESFFQVPAFVGKLQKFSWRRFHLQKSQIVVILVFHAFQQTIHSHWKPNCRFCSIFVNFLQMMFLMKKLTVNVQCPVSKLCMKLICPMQISPRWILNHLSSMTTKRKKN